ncbi:MAG TPA: hypothetical protein VGC47_15220 [Acidimicrobiia bacterium]|jgi:hypothetical protein
MSADEGHPASSAEHDDEDLPWPVGFLILVVAAGLYLLWRAIQIAGWLIDRIT